jgi:hypothetical protein
MASIVVSGGKGIGCGDLPWSGHGGYRNQTPRMPSELASSGARGTTAGAQGPHGLARPRPGGSWAICRNSDSPLVRKRPFAPDEDHVGEAVNRRASTKRRRKFFVPPCTRTVGGLVGASRATQGWEFGSEKFPAEGFVALVGNFKETREFRKATNGVEERVAQEVSISEETGFHTGVKHAQG